MIPRPLEVTGCVVKNCPERVAALMEILADTVTHKPVPGAVQLMLEVPVCARHAEQMDSTNEHVGASFYVPHGPRFRRVVLFIDGQPDEGKERRRWPTYQELVAKLARGESLR